MFRFFGGVAASAWVIAAFGLFACNPVSLLLPSLKEAPPANDADFNDEFLPGPPQLAASPAGAPALPASPVAGFPEPVPVGSSVPLVRPSTQAAASGGGVGGGGGTGVGGDASSGLPAVSVGDPFLVPDFQNIKTANRFDPAFSFALLSTLRADSSPTLETSIYQTSSEVELREARLLLENCSLRYDRFSVGQSIGTVVLEVGTPPKATLTGSLRVTDTDGRSRVTVEAKANNDIASAYVADIRFRQVEGHLSVVSIANLSRGNDAQGVHLTERSARVTQRLDAGFLVLPQRVGPFRMRALLYGENDPNGGGTPLKVVRETFNLTE